MVVIPDVKRPERPVAIKSMEEEGTVTEIGLVLAHDLRRVATATIVVIMVIAVDVIGRIGEIEEAVEETVAAVGVVTIVAIEEASEAAAIEGASEALVAIEEAIISSSSHTRSR